ncbi:MAG: DUF2281 domain-containing protein [Cyanobacteriota bacterium]|jgi:hypothetical protein
MNLEEAILTEIKTLSNQQQKKVLDFTLLLKEEHNPSCARSPLFGSDKDKIYIGDNFDDPLEDFGEYTK